MISTLAIDPGLRGCGVASFLGLDLQGARYIKNPILRGDDLSAIRSMGEAIADYTERRSFDLLVLEFPQVYQGGKQKGDPRDLLTLAAIGGAIIGMIDAIEVRRFFPRDWKGQIDKDTCQRRILERLSPAEFQKIDLPCLSLSHNVWDSIGIGLKAIGRFEPRLALDRDPR